MQRTIAQIIVLVKVHVVSLKESLITVVESITTTFSSIAASKISQILVRMTIRSSVVDLRTIIVDEKLQKRF